MILPPNSVDTNEVPISADSRSPLMHSAKGFATLAGVGAVVGGTLGTLMLGAMQINAPGGLSWVDIPFSLMFGGTFGAAVGTVAAPLFSGLLLRRATVGQAILWTGIGTVVGVIATRFVGGWLTLNGCLGFAAGAVFLSVYSRLVTKSPAQSQQKQPE